MPLFITSSQRLPPHSGSFRPSGLLPQAFLKAATEGTIKHANSGFSVLALLTFWDREFFVVRNYLVYQKMFSNILGSTY